MWYIATDDGIVLAHDYKIDDGVIYIERGDIVGAMSASVITGKTATCPEDMLPPVLSSVGVKNLVEITIPWERVRFFVNAEDTETEPEEEPEEEPE